MSASPQREGVVGVSADKTTCIPLWWYISVFGFRVENIPGRSGVFGYSIIHEALDQHIYMSS